MNESCHTYEWVMSHIWMSHVATCQRVMSHIEFRVLHYDSIFESCHTYQWVMSHISNSQFTCMNFWYHTEQESCHTYDWVMRHVTRDSFVLVTCLIRVMRHVTRICIGDMSTWLICIGDMSNSWHTNESCRHVIRDMNVTRIRNVILSHASCHTN